ncbi:TetR/AcrR family transcriptional regulator [Streptomyces sp. NBC_00237]|uniref:TetR/AcrR family transcriptional regulator n=1 Tax=Streptomyces sp. NBC_00237 TaxID=2975687 RepID=UPI0022515222|nr:TetR/AcrR family transcriptional regulator [Streptomyces sp. NBC_00237]MCX5206708.1 TetR/AcrR family transcriptional regulator [Streptomyces sp. NBC_00237]
MRDIKAIALRHLATGGVTAISLRGIAREMGMTAGALYNYFDTRDDLIGVLIADTYNELADSQEAARDKVPSSDPAGRILVVGETFRRWAINNPAGFRLIYGDPLPGCDRPENSRIAEAERRSCMTVLGLVAGAWDSIPDEMHSAEVGWPDFHASLVAPSRAEFPHLPPGALSVALRLWGRMYGLVALEVFGHLKQQTRDPEGLYRSEMLDLIRSLGLKAPKG